jgi:hypothetical protein
MNWKYARHALAAAAVVAATAGCAEERDPINRVQANALAKSFFVGEDLVNDADNPDFYANGTLLDIGYGASVMGLFTAFYSNDLSIIRWEITEDLLIGRLAYERIEGSDGKGAGPLINNGQVIYAFKIKSHFDIRRSYNPSTGEEMNVVEENTSDRPWNQRQYMRVDWTRNIVTDAYDFDTLAVYGLFGGLSWEELGYYISDPTHEHAPRFEPSDGYFDITTRAYATPGMLDIGYLGWGLSKLPACWVDGDFRGGTAPAGNCNPVEVTIRHSFWKKPDRDYEPQDWDGYRFQSAGAFLKERSGYVRDYGMSDTEWHRFVQRYNIWDRSHHYTDPANMTGAVRCYIPTSDADPSRGEVGTPGGASPTRDLDNNGTHDECEAVGGGSRCDEFSQKCTLPYAKRDVRPIVWYFTNDSDTRYYDATFASSQDWDLAMKQAVLAARNAECWRINGPDCDMAYPMPHGQMAMLQDALDIEREVDSCRKAQGTWDVAACANVVDAELAKRGYEQNTPDHAGLRALGTMDDIVVLCHSPIHADDHPLCAPGKPRLPAGITMGDCQVAKEKSGDPAILEHCRQAYTVRIGDVRHHLVNVVRSPETPSPWGFGPTYANPLTGEAVSASINVWAAPTDFISRSVVDVGRFIAGELSVSDVTDGEFVKDWAAAVEASSKHSIIPPMTRDAVERHVEEGLLASGRSLQSGQSPELAGPVRYHQGVAEAAIAKTDPILEQARVTRFDSRATATKQHAYLQRAKQAQGTETEVELTTHAMLQLAGVTGSDLNLGSDIQMALGSPLRNFNNPTVQRELRHMKELGMAHRGACMMHADDFAPSPTAMVGLTKILQEKFGSFDAQPCALDDGACRHAQVERADRMKAYVADKMHYAVMIHEMGHTFGLRHNFVSSSGAFHYRPQYWQLRTKNGTVTDKCTDLANSPQEAAACVGPRYFDPVTDEEQDNLIHMWSHSSVMDYAGDYSQDFLGLGIYDYHASRMFYGDTASVFEDASLNRNTPLSTALHDTIMDSFGGIIGLKYASGPADFPAGTTNIHYSELNTHYGLISDCQVVDPESFRPAHWNEERDGAWHPVLDGFLVQVDGQFSRCKDKRVNYASWEKLRNVSDDPNTTGDDQPTGRVGPTIYKRPDGAEQTRVPYGFATDRWADLGNLAVYRHDAGADAYELFEFFIAEQETRHIFDNYRRNRHGFSVRSASSRILSRYNEKMRDGAKGMTLLRNSIHGFALERGFEPTSLMVLYLNYWDLWENMLASGMAFDHFARQLQRPESGGHSDPRQTGQSLTIPLVSDTFQPAMFVPDGPQGFWNAVGIGGKLLENRLADDKGEYDAMYTMNAGSYYDKIYVPMLLTESVDNFISSSLDAFKDARFRAVSMADLFPDGFRRMLANNLTTEEWLKGPHVAANTLGRALVTSDLYPEQPLGWTTWWTQSPEVCFAGSGTSICTGFDENGAPFEPNTPQFTRPIDPQVGWEQHKFLIAMTLIYLPENQKQTWLDMLGIWVVGQDSDPGFENRIELHAPTGDVYVARTYGTEEICFEECKTVQRGIGARMLEHANELLQAAYVTTPVTQNGVTWYIPVLQNGAPIVKSDPNLTWLTPTGFGAPPPANCTTDPDPTDNDYSTYAGCKCENNGACLALEDYLSVPEFMRSAMRDTHMALPSMKGIY